MSNRPLSGLLRWLLTLALLLPTILPTLADGSNRLPATFAAASTSTFVSPLPPTTPSRLALTLDADPAWAAPGDVVTFTVTAANRGDTPLAGLTLTDALPDGLRYVAGSAVGFTYAASQKQLTWQPAVVAAGATITGSFQAHVQGLALGATVTNTVTISTAELVDPVNASAVVAVVSPRNNEAWATPGQGGLLRSSDDRVLLRVPAGAVRGRTRLTYAPETDAPHPPPGLRFAFRLAAADAQGQAVREFPAPLALTVVYRLPPAAPWPGLFYYDEAADTWLAAPHRYERRQGQLAAQLAHFTAYAIATNPAEFEFDPGPHVRGAQPQLFSGSIGYTFPFDLPPGRGGFTPQLGLTYSSSRHQLHTGHFSLAGIGWGVLGENYITRDPINPGSNPVTLMLNGASYTISTDTWRAKEDPYIVASNLVDPPAINAPRHIEITTRDGTRYSFKGVAYTDSTADLTGDAAPLVYKWENCDQSAISWLRLPLTQARDRYGNTIDYYWRATYSGDGGYHGEAPSGQMLEGDGFDDHPQCGAVGASNYVRTIRLTKIVYNGVEINLEYDTPGPGVGRQDRPTEYDHPGVHLFPIHTLQAVSVKVGSTEVRRYELGHDAVQGTSQGQLLLRNAQEKAGNLTRSTGFEYASALTWPCSDGYLNQITGPLGGRVNFTATTGDGTVCTKSPPAVTGRTETDPITGRSWAWTYNFSGWHQDAFGYAEARVLTPPTDGSSGSQLLAVHSFHTVVNANNTDLTHLAGREFLLRACDATDIGSSCTASNELTRTETDWQHTTAGVPGYQEVPEQWKPRFVYASETRTYELGQPFKRTTYEYQAERQGGQNYGNLTRIKEYNSQIVNPSRGD